MKIVTTAIAVLAAIGWSATAAADETPSLATRSVSIDVLEPAVGGALANLWGTYLEEQLAVSDHLSLAFEESYLESGNYRAPGGSDSGLHTRMAIAAIGVLYWPRRPFDGPFLSVRPEAWLVSAEDSRHVVASGNQFDVNVQPGWQWTWDHVSVTASASFAYASGPVRSADGTVAFPIHGWSGTPHLRIGWVW